MFEIGSKATVHDSYMLENFKETTLKITYVNSTSLKVLVSYKALKVGESGNLTSL